MKRLLDDIKTWTSSLALEIMEKCKEFDVALPHFCPLILKWLTKQPIECDEGADETTYRVR